MVIIYDDDDLMKFIDKIFKEIGRTMDLTEKKKIKYSSEKILKKSTKDENDFSGKYKEMMAIKSKYSLYENCYSYDKEQFYLQAKYMEDYEENYEDKNYEKIVFNMSFSNDKFLYNSFSSLELKSYFFWRTNIRNSKIVHTNRFFLILYLYEILGGIGFDSKEKIFFEMLKVYNMFGNSFKTKVLIESTLKDFIIYHNLDKSLVNELPKDCNKSSFYLQAISDAVNTGDYSNFTNSIANFSSYKILSSKFYIKFEKDYDECLKVVYNNLHKFYLKNRKISLFKKLFGKKYKLSGWVFFGYFSFYKEHTETFEFVLNDFEEYDFIDGKCTKIYSNEQIFNKLLIGEILKTVESYLRSFYKYKALTFKSTSQILTDLIEKTVEEYCTDNNKHNFCLKEKQEKSEVKKQEKEKLKQQKEIEKQEKLKLKQEKEIEQSIIEDRKVINIDISKFDEIRSTSEKIKEKLITGVEELKEIETKYILNNKKIEESKGMSAFVNDLSNTEKLVLNCILNNESEKIQQILKEDNIMLSVLLENINEKALIYIDDNIIDAYSVLVYDEYVKNLEVLIKCQCLKE